MRILASCDAEPGDQVILTGRQFDRILRQRGIKNLVYTGFATNMCILDSAAATREMLGFGYRIFLIREATLAVEYPETFPTRMMTEAAPEVLPAQGGGHHRLPGVRRRLPAVASAGRAP